jgi:hypothetical protein
METMKNDQINFKAKTDASTKVGLDDYHRIRYEDNAHNTLAGTKASMIYGTLKDQT